MQKPSVAVIIAYQAKEGKAEEGAARLRDLIATVVAEEPDCRLIRMYRDPENQARMLLYEEWTSKEAYLGPHFETPHIKAFKAEAGEFFAGPPDIQFWDLKHEFVAR